MNLIITAVLESCLSHHNSLEVASLALRDNYNVAEPELWGQLEVVMRDVGKTITFGVLNCVLERRKKSCFPVTVRQPGRTGRLSDRLTARQLSRYERSAWCSAGRQREVNSLNFSPASSCFTEFHHLVMKEKNQYEGGDKSLFLEVQSMFIIKSDISQCRSTIWSQRFERFDLIYAKSITQNITSAFIFDKVISLLYQRQSRRLIKSIRT